MGLPRPLSALFVLCFALLLSKINVDLNTFLRLSKSLQLYQAREDTAWAKSAETYIVRFKDYKPSADHLRALQRALAGKSDSWAWIPRQNAASKYPTDFGLVQLPAADAQVKDALIKIPFVRDVHPDRKLLKSLLHVPGQRNDASFVGAAEEMEGIAMHAKKRPGRMQTRPTFSLAENQADDNENAEHWMLSHRTGNDSSPKGRAMLGGGTALPFKLGANRLWEQGFKGQGIKMGVFDTGIRGDHPHVKNIRERTNWTHEPTLDDGLGHGSFVAGVIAGSDEICPGLAPEVELYTFRVFTNDQVSYTSWFLDAFNYAMASEMDVVNLSIGGPDHLDAPFVEKVLEITSSGIMMVSAIGNDGPLYGTLNNPADQNDVIGVGGIDFFNNIASFSSRGMSTWELPLGYGRSKPDVMAFGKEVQGSRISTGCRSLSGTSVASPVVAGVVCLLASVVPQEKRWMLNPASMKQALVEGADRLPQLNIYEQGQGKVNVLRSKEILDAYEPRASIVPASLDLTKCPNMWPFCKQPLYAGAMPTMFNATVLNGMSLSGRFDKLEFTPTNEAGKLLELDFEYSDMLWPWSGFLAIYIRVRDAGVDFNGTATGNVSFNIVSPPRLGQSEQQVSRVTMPLTAAIIPTPPRQKRVLWDQFHSIRYPPGYFPRDDLQVRNDILDWHGDHPHTNFHEMYDYLRKEGYYLEVLASPLTCFNASQYGALMVVDPEDEFYQEEISKLESDVRLLGLGLLVFGDWYDEEALHKLRFYDDNTRSWWEAATGGSNIPALNDLLGPYGVAFGTGALDGSVLVPGATNFKMASGVPVAALPTGAHLHLAMLASKQGSMRGQALETPVLGLLGHGTGKVTLYGDSSCLDSSHQRSNCFQMLQRLLEYATEGKESLLTSDSILTEAFGSYEGLPQRRPDFNFTTVSPVLRNPLRCYRNSPREFHGMEFSQWRFNISRPPIPPRVGGGPVPLPGQRPTGVAIPLRTRTDSPAASGGDAATAVQGQRHPPPVPQGAQPGSEGVGGAGGGAAAGHGDGESPPVKQQAAGGVDPEQRAQQLTGDSARGASGKGAQPAVELVQLAAQEGVDESRRSEGGRTEPERVRFLGGGGGTPSTERSSMAEGKGPRAAGQSPAGQEEGQVRQGLGPAGAIISTAQMIAVMGLVLVGILWLSLTRRRRRGFRVMGGTPAAASRRPWWRQLGWFGSGREEGRDV